MEMPITDALTQSRNIMNSTIRSNPYMAGHPGINGENAAATPNEGSLMNQGVNALVR